MNIDICITASEKIRAVKNVQTLKTISAIFKDDTSITSPVLLVKRDDAIMQCNYVKIPSLNRVYFVEDKKTVTNGMIELYCECDLLSTAYNQLLNENCILEKQESINNAYFVDNLPTENRIQVVFKEFPKGLENTMYYYLLIGG